MNLADTKRLSIGTAIYMIPENEYQTIHRIREIFESTHEFDGIEKRRENHRNTGRRIGIVRLCRRRAGVSSWEGWCDAQEIETNRNIAIARWEEMIHQLCLIKGCAYDEENLKKFRQYGSAREALYAESIRIELEEFAKSSVLLRRRS